MNRIVLHIENDYDYANVVNIDNFSTLGFKRTHTLEPWMDFAVGKETEEEINIIRTKTKYDEELVSFVSKRDSTCIHLIGPELVGAYFFGNW